MFYKSQLIITAYYYKTTIMFINHISVINHAQNISDADDDCKIIISIKYVL
jgi:hypothetical protein